MRACGAFLWRLWAGGGSAKDRRGRPGPQAVAAGRSGRISDAFRPVRAGDCRRDLRRRAGPPDAARRGQGARTGRGFDAQGGGGRPGGAPLGRAGLFRAASTTPWRRRTGRCAARTLDAGSRRPGPFRRGWRPPWAVRSLSRRLVGLEGKDSGRRPALSASRRVAGRRVPARAGGADAPISGPDVRGRRRGARRRTRPAPARRQGTRPCGAAGAGPPGRPARRRVGARRTGPGGSPDTWGRAAGQRAASS